MHKQASTCLVTAKIVQGERKAKLVWTFPSRDISYQQIGRTSRRFEYNGENLINSVEQKVQS